MKLSLPRQRVPYLFLTVLSLITIATTLAIPMKTWLQHKDVLRLSSPESPSRLPSAGTDSCLPGQEGDIYGLYRVVRASPHPRCRVWSTHRPLCRRSPPSLDDTMKLTAEAEEVRYRANALVRKLAHERNMFVWQLSGENKPILASQQARVDALIGPEHNKLVVDAKMKEVFELKLQFEEELKLVREARWYKVLALFENQARQLREIQTEFEEVTGGTKRLEVIGLGFTEADLLYTWCRVVIGIVGLLECDFNGKHPRVREEDWIGKQVARGRGAGGR